MVNGPDLHATGEDLDESGGDGGASYSYLIISYSGYIEEKERGRGRPVAAWKMSAMDRVWVHLV